jgi:hypothetical protein
MPVERTVGTNGTHESHLSSTYYRHKKSGQHTIDNPPSTSVCVCVCVCVRFWMIIKDRQMRRARSFKFTRSWNQHVCPR